MVEPKKPQDRKPKATPSANTVDVTVGGHKYTVLLAGLGDPRMMDDIGFLQEVNDVQESGQEVPSEMNTEAALRVPGMLRRILGYAGARKAHGHLAGEHGADYNIGHTTEFVFALLSEAHPNS